ncbi:MAG: endonuclease III [Planctomycetaceae bacterium]|nr:endonuclease III [Planctomycetaceae bacterium]
MPASREEKNHARRVVRHLTKHYADAECALNYDSPFQLLIATILSAQCTDKRVNIVTADLFAKYPTAHKLARATQKQVEKIVKSAGFYRAKAKNIRACARELVEQYEGQPPRELEQLVALAGVGRKTGNVLLGTAFGIPSGVVVDTHVGRISRRLGITFEKDPVKVERDLMAVLPKKEWIYYSHRMIHHGRAVCDARKPLCEHCSMKNFCPRIGVK